MASKSQIYRESLEAFCRGDFAAATACYAEDIVAYPNRSMRPMQGRAAMLAFTALGWWVDKRTQAWRA